MDGSAPRTTARARWLGLLAQAPEGQLAALCAGLPRPDFTWLRRPEIGTVMLRGRIGGTGAPFSLGEMTVTRAALQLADGTQGHGHVQGRDKAAAEWAAICDALLQTARAAEVEARVLGPLAAAADGRAAVRAAKAAATKVEFFTLVRGEDQ